MLRRLVLCADTPRSHEMEDPENIARMRLVYGGRDEQLDAVLGESLSPRAPSFLLDLAVPLLATDSRLLDVGCRDARHLIPLVMRSGCSGVGIDPVEVNVDHARAAVAASGLDERVDIRRGVMGQIEEPDESIDLVWCRDVLEVIPDLRAGVREVARVLKPGGAAVIYTVFATPRLEPREAATLHGPLGNMPRNLERPNVEAAFDLAGFRVERLEEVGTEFREYEEERSQPVSESLSATRAASSPAYRRDPEIRKRRIRGDGSLTSLARLLASREARTCRLRPAAAVARPGRRRRDSAFARSGKPVVLEAPVRELLLEHRQSLIPVAAAEQGRR